VLSWGSNPSAKPMTVYVRTTFNAGTVSGVTGITARLLVDDGAVIYLNGTEVYRFNLPTGTITNATAASRYIAGTEEQQWRTVTLPATALVNGTNTLAVEVHEDPRRPPTSPWTSRSPPSGREARSGRRSDLTPAVPRGRANLVQASPASVRRSAGTCNPVSEEPHTAAAAAIS
jgi:hypothetical protein